MSNIKSDIFIKWSPFRDDEFILVGNNILLYRILSYDGSITKNRIDNSNLFLSENSYAKLIGSISNYPNQKQICWYSGGDVRYYCYTIALHEHNSDQIKLLSLYNQTDNNELINLEIENQRKSNQLEWGPLKCNYVAAAFDKIPDTSSLLIWDALHSTKPIYQLDEFETCNSLSWHYDNPNILFVTSSNNCISFYDLRTGTKPVEILNTEYINGFSIDPKNSVHAASFDKNKFVLWDLRKLNSASKPIDCIEESKMIREFQFCPCKAGRVGILLEDSNHVNVYRLEERNDTLYRESVQYYKYLKNVAPGILNSFSWHSKNPNRLMVAYNAFNVLMDINVADYCPIGFSADGILNIGMNQKVTRYDSNVFEDEIDIGVKIKQRAIKNYGVQDFLLNVDLLDKNESDVKYLWQWLDSSSKTQEKTIPFFSDKFVGIKTIFSTQYTAYIESGIQSQNLSDIYKKYIYKLCGWNNIKELVQKLESQGEYERAACICVFNTDLVFNTDKAIEILTSASKLNDLNEYLALSVTLSFLNRTSASPDLKDMKNFVNKLTNPYLKALFCYQIDPENFDYSIYNDPNILIPDRVCMGLNILKSDQFTNFINKLTADCIKNGNLFGILLTGFSSDCLELFQNYIHRTGDVQTPAVAIVNSPLIKSPPQKYIFAWIESYRELLNCWMFWEQRSLFDIYRGKFSNFVEPKIHVRCTYCADNISSKRRQNPRAANESQGSNIGLTCQSCQKPSLRCSVCSLHMTVDPSKSAFNGDKDKMLYWFMFCQKCTHGGHMGHLDSWFKVNTECPVMECKCLCFASDTSLDEI